MQQLMREQINDLRELVPRFHRPLAIVAQLMLIVAANGIAFLLRFDGDPPEWALVAFWQMLPWLVVVRAFTFFPFRLYEGLWRYTGIYDLQAVIGGVGASSLVFYGLVNSPLGP